MLASRQPVTASVHRDAWVEVDLNAIEENIAVVRSWLKPQTKLLAVVKSDAYGHGALGVAEVLTASGANWLGVASVDEGCQLRGAGVKNRILILSPCPPWALSTALQSDLDVTVTASSQIEALAEATRRTQKTARMHLKVDTGMHRLGVLPGEVAKFCEEIGHHKGIKLVGVFSHLAKADDRELTGKQNECFKNILKQLSDKKVNVDLIHLASGDATRLFPETHYNMIRPGLILYGLEARAVSQVVRPAMSVRGRITHMQNIPAGESVGYNHTWRAARPTKIASIPIGYADGIDRGLSNNMTGLLLGQQVNQIGLISMDQMLFDVTDVPQAEEGDIVTLIGSDTSLPPGSASTTNAPKTLHLATWANQLDTITYELACRLRVRMPRVYTRPAIAAGRAAGDFKAGGAR